MGCTMAGLAMSFSRPLSSVYCVVNVLLYFYVLFSVMYTDLSNLYYIILVMLFKHII